MSTFNEVISKIKPIVELIYLTASIGLVWTVIIGLKQLKLIKNDMQDNHKRASIEKSIEYLNWFATDFIPKTNDYNNDVAQKGIVRYEGPYNDLFVFDHNCKFSNKQIADNFWINTECGSNSVVNQLEFFSAAVLSGLADENLLFNPVAKMYCDMVEKLYVVICYSRDNENTTLYTNSIKLYKVWSSKLKKLKLEKSKLKIDEDISKIKEENIRSIGRR